MYYLLTTNVALNRINEKMEDCITTSEEVKKIVTKPWVAGDSFDPVKILK